MKNLLETLCRLLGGRSSEESSLLSHLITTVVPDHLFAVWGRGVAKARSTEKMSGEPRTEVQAQRCCSSLRLSASLSLECAGFARDFAKVEDQVRSLARTLTEDTGAAGIVIEADYSGAIHPPVISNFNTSLKSCRCSIISFVVPGVSMPRFQLGRSTVPMTR